MDDNKSLRERLISAARARVEKVELDNGLCVWVREMTGAERDDWEQSLVGEKGHPNTKNVSARLLLYCLVDEQGERLFEDAQEIGAMSASVLSPLREVAQRLNKLSPEDVATAEGN